jgi:hypothetical protein
LLWLAAPEGVDCLINPVAWVIMSKRLTFNGENLLEWMCNPLYKAKTSTVPDKLRKLKTLNIERGLNSFHRNFDAIIDTLFKNKMIQGGSEEQQDFRAFIEINRDKIFSKYVPIPSKVAFIMETTATGVYADTSMTPAIDAIRTLSGIETTVAPHNLRVRQGRAVQAVNKLGEYYQTFFSDQLGSKPGWFRKHVFGSRLHFSFRAVISSLTDNHEADELHLPWSMSVALFEAHLSSKLIKRGFTPNEVIKHLHEHTSTYDPLIDELFKEIIAEGPDGSIPVIFQRNPSLTRGSAQQLRVTKVKTDPEINTVSLSVLVLKALNADFDGDALNGILILDLVTLEKISRLQPYLYALDLGKPRTLSRHIGLPPPVITTIANWLHRGR